MRVTFMRATNLVPQMFVWLAARYLEHRSVSSIVDGFERFLASRGLARARDPLGPPAIAFVDLSGFTRLTRERGDESAVRAATSLQRRAHEAARRHGGRLVKLLGDGAMLRLADATAGVLIGVGAATKLFPGALLPVLAAVRSIFHLFRFVLRKFLTPSFSCCFIDMKINNKLITIFRVKLW